MKSLRYCLILILLGLSSSAALANTIPDPKVGFGPVGSNGSFNQSQCIIPNVEVPPPPFCSFTTDGNGTSVIDITNDLGAFIVQDTVMIDSFFTGTLSCVVLEGAPGWTAANATGNPCVFNGGFVAPGHIYGLTFSLFAANTTYFFDLKDRVPEPGTIILLGTGLVALMMRRKALKRVQPV